MCFHRLAICCAIIALRDHTLDNARPAWLKLKGANRWSSPRGQQYLEEFGYRPNWAHFLNGLLENPAPGSNVQDYVETAKKRGRPKKTAVAGLPAPPAKKKAPKVFHKTSFDAVK